MWQQQLTPAICSSARHARDARFDGRFFVAVRTTGIYCRPVCRVRMPLERNVEYYPTAAAAEAAGFRPCLKCRPETAPGSPQWNGAGEQMARGLRMLEQVGPGQAPAPLLAEVLGISRRQVDRLFCERMGATPAAILRNRRLLLAKQLISDSALPMTEVAFAAGYSSIRRFNAHFSAVYGFPPSQLRRGSGPVVPHGGVALQLGYRPPYDWSARLRFLAARALTGIEQVTATDYRCSLRLASGAGLLTISDCGERNCLRVRIECAPRTPLLPVVNRLRRALDLDADPLAIGDQLQADPMLAAAIRRYPGIRLPAALDPFEVAVRAVVGQQVSVRAARTIMQRLLARHGAPVSGAPGEGPVLVFPDADELAHADLDGLGLTGRRATTLRDLGRAVAAGDVPLDGSVPLNEFVAAICRVPGVGDWTAQYVALRGLAEPDAFPAGDLILRRRASTTSTPLSERALRSRAEAWRPWRAYAVLLLWQSPAIAVPEHEE